MNWDGSGLALRGPIGKRDGGYAGQPAGLEGMVLPREVGSWFCLAESDKGEEGTPAYSGSSAILVAKLAV
jgi:hypothetical protein